MHEMGHHYLNELEQIAEITGENSQAARDLQEINKWANWKDGMAAEYEDTASEKEFAELEKEILSAEEKGDTKKAEELKERWKQERFARGVEEYLSEGIAPTAKLKKIFDNFKNWLKEIYRGLRGAGAKPSDDVQAVMERMFASDKEILSGRASRLTGETKAAYDKALADLKAAGVKNAEANAYLAAKMAERLKTAYEEKGQSVSVLSLLPEIRAQDIESTQTKSATDNNGEFDANDPSILHQKSSKSPIENQRRKEDNETGRSKVEQAFREQMLKGKVRPLNAEARNNGIMRSIVNEFNKQIDKLEREGWTEKQIQDLLQRENSFLLKDVIKPWAEVANKFHTEHTGKKGVVCEILRDEKACDNVGYKAIDEVYDIFKKRAERMIDDAKLVFAECAYARRSGRNLDGLHSWRELEQSIAKHGGTAQFKVRPSENTEQLNTPSETKHSKTGAFSIAEKDGKFNVELNTESLDKSKLDNLKTLVDSYNGKISDKGVSFTFDDKSTLDKFMQVSEAYLSTTDEDTKAKASNAVDIIEKFSAEKLKENSIAKLAANAKIINAKDLTTAEKKFTEMGDKLGAPVVWVDADPRLNGWHKDGVTFINRNRRMSGEKTFWHESLHFIIQNEEELLKELAEAVI